MVKQLRLLENEIQRSTSNTNTQTILLAVESLLTSYVGQLC
jgi:hypothetical protein